MSQYVMLDVRSSEMMIETGGGVLAKALQFEPEALASANQVHTCHANYYVSLCIIIERCTHNARSML
jgi:hypothetical protein